LLFVEVIALLWIELRCSLKIQVFELICKRLVHSFITDVQEPVKPIENFYIATLNDCALVD
jgi:hypothetical protein